jgi:hypothetical protein
MNGSRKEWKKESNEKRKEMKEETSCRRKYKEEIKKGNKNKVNR